MLENEQVWLNLLALRLAPDGIVLGAGRVNLRNEISELSHFGYGRDRFFREPRREQALCGEPERDSDFQP